MRGRGPFLSLRSSATALTVRGGGLCVCCVQNGNATVSTVTCLATLVDGTLVTGSTDTKLSVWRSGYAQPAIAA